METSGLLTTSLVLFLEAVFLRMESSVKAAEAEVVDYCQADTFQATCSDNQILLMLSARYGRMRKGKCVKGDYGALGCHMDALGYMESLCSGSKECQFRVFDSKLRERTPCPEDVASYLEASYHCVDVVVANKGQCGGQKQIVLTEPRGYLASIVSQEYGLGTVDCPWVVRASPGQMVTLFLRYFGSEKEGTGVNVERSQQGLCYDLVTFREAGSLQQTITTCDGIHREREVLVSKGNEVKVQLVGRMHLRLLGKFVMRYQVIGCADYSTPFNATMKREGEKLTIKCNNSEHIWYLVCQNSTWLGETVICNHGSAAAWNLRQIFDSSSFPFGILLVVAIGVALGIFCGGLLLTCVVFYMKRQRRLHQTMDECTDFRTFDGYEVHAPGDLTDLATPDDDLAQGVKTIHPYTARHYVGAQGSSSGVSSMDHVSEYDKQFASIKSYGQKTPVCSERCNYPSLGGRNHLYEMPHAV